MSHALASFKRGKSTLIKRADSDPVLPVGVHSCTAVPTVIKVRDQRRAGEYKWEMAPGTTFPYPISISTYRKVKYAAARRTGYELGHASSPPCASLPRP